MNPKKLITAALLVFVAGSLGYMVVRENKSAPQPAPLPEVSQVEPGRQLIVYYFHGDARCATCLKLEKYAKEALDTYFADDLAAGKIQWKPTNVDTPGNEPFVKHYGLVTKSVILSRVENGRELAWKNLDQVWQLVSDKGKYVEYIRDGVKAFAAQEQK